MAIWIRCTMVEQRLRLLIRHQAAAKACKRTVQMCKLPLFCISSQLIDFIRRAAILLKLRQQQTRHIIIPDVLLHHDEALIKNLR